MTATSAETTGFAVEFTTPMLGLSPHRKFTLEQIAGAEGLYALRAADADVRLFLLDPLSGDYGYAPALPADVRSELGASEESEVRVFVVANPADDGVYINLRAPVLVHRETGRAVQVILDDQAYPIRALLGS
ncbi:flagellar assembly protein FliW [Microbacterium sp. CGR1]|uniref:flagellar assembly protein FliW n=1 Tax=Microbacterium sp. CGR1 TaxID=1696072 RepID=UPI003DA64D5B